MRTMRMSAAAAALSLTLAAVASAQQASIKLSDSNVQLCQDNDTAWTLTKSGSILDNHVTWVIDATRGATTHNFIKVFGYVNVKNAGTAPAPIGNVVVNLQRKYG